MKTARPAQNHSDNRADSATINAATGSNNIAARQITISLRYKCPPGTGTPNELKATFIAIKIAVVHRLSIPEPLSVLTG